MNYGERGDRYKEEGLRTPATSHRSLAIKSLVPRGWLCWDRALA